MYHSTHAIVGFQSASRNATASFETQSMAFKGRLPSAVSPTVEFHWHQCFYDKQSRVKKNEVTSNTFKDHG
jgi:hypothetical protein